MATVIVTGTSTGIGCATAEVLGRAGHDVYATMRNPERAPELERIAANEKLPITILTLDVNDEDSVSSAVNRVLSDRGSIDILVNNAGIGADGPIEELSLDEFRNVMETNFFGALRCIKAVLPSMRERKSGCLINVTSISGRIAVSPQGPYAASKFALEAVSEVLAQELKAFNIRVAIVEPGVIKTALLGKLREIPTDTRYPQARRLYALFEASLKNPISPEFVGDAIRQIVEGDSWQLRHPVGPDAVPFLTWRAGMSDEEWIDFGATQDDEEWYSRIHRDFGLDARPRS